jgi:beta-galactosidase/beta-glucuronidase
MQKQSGQTDPHPRPQLERTGWISLNGLWDFAIDVNGDWKSPDQVDWTSQIKVPFAPETPASGVHHTGFFQGCWYRRGFKAPDISDGRRLIIHFGAVDYLARVWINGQFVGCHEGGYTPFCCDITDQVKQDERVIVVVHAEDDPFDLAKPRGKQDWQLMPHSIWYWRTSGIWQTVWLEVVPQTSINYLRWTPSVEKWEIGVEARICEQKESEFKLRIVLTSGATLLVDDTYTVISGEVHRRIALSDPGIDDYRNGLLWSPSSPTLIRARIELLDVDNQIVDIVTSYTALRSIGVQGNRFVLNGRPYQLRLVLDQGYWPETGLTAPSDEALRHDVEMAKAMGFNGVRKHQKIEAPGYLYWADTLGLLVWEEMPSAYRFTKTSIERLTREWSEAITRDISHPCIVAWVPFNESWGVPDLPDSPTQRHYVQALYHLTKTLDPTRPVIGNDGWESVATDIIGIHDYDAQPERLVHRYGGDDQLPRLFKTERPGGRLLAVDGHNHQDQPLILTEFGGIAYSQDKERTWGYARVDSSETFAGVYSKLLSSIHLLHIFSGFCYTQFADTYQEANGLLFADRTPKFPLEQIRAATRGPSKQNESLDSIWRERLMTTLRTQYLIPVDDYQTQHSR